MAKKTFPGLTPVPGALKPIKKQNTIRTRVSDILNSYGNIRKAEKEAYSSYKKGLKTKSYIPWNNELRNGKIYIFQYDPKTADMLDFYDKNPVVLSLGQKKVKDGVLDLGVNLNFLPLRFKLSLLEQVEQDLNSKKIEKKIKKSKTVNTKSQSPLFHITYDWCKKFLAHIGYEFALRSYYRERRTGCVETAYEEWENISLLNIVDMEKLNINQVKALFEKYYQTIKKKKPILKKTKK